LAPVSDVVVIVDVLSFSTCLDVANCRGAIVFPFQWKDESAAAFAQSICATLASNRGEGGLSLSPASLLAVGPCTRLVLPSPNGSTLTLAAGSTPTLAGCLRNCRAVALAAMKFGRHISVIPAGERWSDGSLRPAIEDLIGAGAVISFLEGKLSPEAQLAKSAYEAASTGLVEVIAQCGSGRELIDRGFVQDVSLASEVNISDCVPFLFNGAYSNQGGTRSG
jgi:2-phosphosulfolactate phosphatase